MGATFFFQVVFNLKMTVVIVFITLFTIMLVIFIFQVVFYLKITVVSMCKHPAVLL